MKHLLRPIALSLLWLSVGLACKKEDVEPCEQEGCCAPKVTARLAAILNGMAVGKLRKEQQSLGLKEIIYDKEPYKGQQKQITFLFLCPGHEEVINAFLTEQEAKPDYNPNQEYKLWGWIYQDNFNPPSYFPDRIYALRINRIEKIP